MKVNNLVWDETQNLIESGVSFVGIGSYLITTILIGIPLYIIVGVVRKIKPNSKVDVSTKGGDLSWKKLLFGNPFKRNSSKKDLSSIPNNLDLFGTPSEPDKKDSSKNDLSTRIFDSRQEAGDAIGVELRKAYYQEIFYTITVRCPNCRIEGVVRLTRGQAADEAECPRCEVEGLQVVGVGINREGDIINSPRLDEETETTISEQVQNAVEHAWSIGRIKRGSIFE